MGADVVDVGPGPGDERFARVRLEAQSLGRLAQRLDLADAHRHQEVTPGREVPIERRVADAGPSGDQIQGVSGPSGTDVVTAGGWEDRDAFQAWKAAVSDERVGIDEERFLDRSQTRAALIEDGVAAG